MGNHHTCVRVSVSVCVNQGLYSLGWFETCEKLEKPPALPFIFFCNWMKTKAWKHTQFSLLEFDVLYNYIQIIFCLSLVEFFILNDGIHK